jgi:hypothetical protein
MMSNLGHRGKKGAILQFIRQSADRVGGYLINPAGLTSEEADQRA